MSKLSGRLIAATAAAAFAACSTATVASAQTKVRYVEVVRNLAYLPSYVAMGKGFFKEEGLDVSLSTAQGGDKVSALMLSNSADIALVGPETAVYVQNSESPMKLKIFSALTGTSTNFLMARKAPAGAFNWSAVKGTTVLGWRPGSTPELFLEFAMRKHGIDPKKDVNLVTNVAVPARIGAWLSGTGAYSIFSEPDATVIEKQGKGQRVAFVGREVGKVDYTVFVASDDYMKKNPKTVQAFTNAIYKAQRFTATADPIELGKLTKQFFPRITEDQIAEVVKRYRAEQLWPVDPMIYEKSIETLQDILIQGGVLKPDKRVKHADVAVNSFAQEAKAKIK